MSVARGHDQRRRPDTGSELHAAARDAYRQSLRDGEPLIGAEIGDRFGRSARWGRARIAEAHVERQAATPYKVRGPTAEEAAATATAANGTATTADQTAATVADAGGPPTAETAAAARLDGCHQPTELVSPRVMPARDLRADPQQCEDDDQQIGRYGHQSAATADDITGSAPTARQTARPVTDREVSDTVDEAVSPAIRRTTTLAVLAVAFVAAVASFDHQRVLAEMAGEGWRSWRLPISVDGLVVAASMSLLVHRRTREGALAWAALLLGLGASLAANVVAADPALADPALIRRVVAAWPPLALGVSFELTVQLLATSRSRR